MAEESSDINADHLEDVENSSKENAIASSQGNENMEVHHHTHAAHGKKTWKEYFWEFLMLFLAVFCGFLAEYKLEHVFEEQRAKEFALSLYQDMKHDTAAFKYQTNYLDTCIVKIDTLINILDEPTLTKENIIAINNLSTYAFIFPAGSPNESTLQQLLNSGSLRYFKDKDLVDSITLYNTQVQQTKIFHTTALDFNTQFRVELTKVLELNPMITMFSQTSNVGNRLTKGQDFNFGNATLLTYDPVKLKEFANWCALKKFYMVNEKKYQEGLLIKMMPVLKILNKEYVSE